MMVEGSAASEKMEGSERGKERRSKAKQAEVASIATGVTRVGGGERGAVR